MPCDNSLVGPSRDIAFERGLADAAWYTTDIERGQLRLLRERCNGPAMTSSPDPTPQPSHAEAVWSFVAESTSLARNDVIRFDRGDATFAIHRLENGSV